MLQQDHPGLLARYDIVHLVSNLIEKLWQPDSRWDEFLQARCRCANAVRQNKLSHLKPPKPKTKARYMNIDREVRLGGRALAVLERVRTGQLTDHQKQRLPLKEVEAKLGWLDAFRSEIENWLELSLIGQRASSVIRCHGYSAGTVAILRRELGEPKGSPSQQLVSQIIAKIEPTCKLSGIANF